MADLAQAIQFLEAFPEAAAWKVCILGRDKNPMFSGPEMSSIEVRKRLSTWVKQRNAHVFVRPLMANIVFLDLDKFPVGHEYFGALVRLQPRAIVRTSNDNYQAWFTIPKACAARDALLVAKALTQCFHADFGSVQKDQQGRLPGTVNVKGGKGCVAVLTHCCTQDMDEATFLQITSGKRFSLKGDEVEVQSLPPKGIGPKSPNGMDRSAQDWKMCCAFFETHPGASIEEARQQLNGQWSKAHNDMAAYTARTLEKSFEKVCGLLEFH
jgi:hypothetical protein